MAATLLDTARRYAEAHADARGIARTLIPGLNIIRATGPGDLRYTISCPLICLVLQGKMRVTVGSRDIEACASETLLLTPDVPAIHRVTHASVLEPYVALLIDLDLAVIENLAADMDAAAPVEVVRNRVGKTDEEVATAALQLMRLIRHPASVTLLFEPLLRQLHYWLLAGRHGPEIQRLSTPDSAARRVARAIAVIRAEFAKSLPIDRLAAVAGMSPSAFHQHFRSATSLTPLQFQKQLRLLEARRLMLSQSMTASNAAFAVGYQSVSQFTREYRRMFGLPPLRETAAARSRSKQRRASTQSGVCRMADHWRSTSIEQSNLA
jgi:AraC-like DNA-binding protein